MDSDETTVENGSTKFTILGLLKKIVAVYLALISNVFTKIQEIFEGINGFIHDKVDEYAPSPIKSLQETLDSQSNKVINKTKSLLGGFSILGDIVDDVKSSITNPVDTARDLVDKTTSLVTDNPVAQAVNSAADKVMEEAKSAGKKAALKSVYASLTLLLIPLIAEAWYKANTKEWFSKFAKAILPLIEKLSEGYNNLVEKMEDKGYSFFEYLPTIPVGEMKAAYKLVKTKNDSIAAVADGLEDAGELASDIVGNIPIVGGIANSISNTADQIMDNTASLILDNPLSQAVGSVADQMMENTEEFATKAALKSVYTALTLLLCPVIAELCYKLREYALIKAVGKAILPLIEDLCEWYNKKIDELDEKGYSFFGYLPTMPITEMKTAYKLVKTANAGIEAVGDGLEAVGSGLGLNNDDDDDE